MYQITKIRENKYLADNFYLFFLSIGQQMI